MRNALLTLTALILTLSTSQAQQAEPNTVRDRLWLFGVPADGPRLFYEGAGYRGGSRITPAERERLKLNPDVGGLWKADHDLMLQHEKTRKARLRRTGYVAAQVA